MSETQTLPTPDLHHADDGYHDALLDSINQAETRILLETMVLNHSDKMEAVLDACLHARKRGVGVLMVYDIYSHLSITASSGLGSLQQFRNRMEQLEEEGVIVHCVGSRKPNPFAGRHHAKASIIDDHVYMGGGVNLSGDSFNSKDFMLRFDDADLTQTLYDTLPAHALDRVEDSVLYDDGTTEVLLDVGNREESLIYDRTCELASKAKRIKYVSKLAPDGRLLDILRSKDVEYWFNSTKSATGFDKLALAIDQYKARLKNNYDGDAELHAKFCVFEMEDGSKEAVTGSHNFNSRGVAFGTQELAIHSKDQALCEKLVAFAEHLPSYDA